MGASGLSARRSRPARSSADVLLATKLHVPGVRPGLVAREDLVPRLVASDRRRLVLVCAPAGWGKTSLLAEWHASAMEERPFAWVTLDPSDDDPVRFWGYVIAALRTVQPDLGSAASAALSGAGAALVEVVMPLLLNDLADVAGRLVLVLDDYHFLHNELIHASVAFLLRHLPPGMQVTLGCRADPPLPLGSLRAAGEMTEIRASELSFSETEAEALLNGSLGTGLDHADVGLLLARTEGWAAGLQLAALSLRTQEDKHAFIEAFAGDDRQIGDYLHEVLAEQPPALREFLLSTSILGRMCAPLCDAVTGQSDGAQQLAAVERSNLFLVPLDTRREWYRYHHLFRDLLRRELESDRAIELHRRAAAWHRERGDADEAIAHATAAGDVDEAAELIAEAWRSRVRSGQTETVIRWIDGLPRDRATSDARLAVASGWAALYRGRLDEVETLLGNPDAAGLPSPFYDGPSAAANVAFLESVYAALRGDVGGSLAAGRAVIAAHPDPETPGRALASIVLGRSLYYAGELSEAVQVLAEAADGLSSGGASVALLAATGGLALARAEAGDPDRAATSAATADRLVEELGLAESEWAALPLLARATLLDQRGEIQEATAALERAVVLAHRGARRLDLAKALISLARLERRLDKPADARAHAREARSVLDTCVDPGMLAELLARTERSLQLAGAPASAAALPADVDLSERELTVLRLLATDLSQREIASELYVSFNTIKSHTRSVFRKLGVADRAAAVARGRELALI